MSSAALVVVNVERRSNLIQRYLLLDSNNNGDVSTGDDTRITTTPIQFYVFFDAIGVMTFAPNNSKVLL